MVPTPEFGDYYVNAEVVLPVGGDMQRGKVVCRKRDADGNPMGRENRNPILDTRLYEVEFADGRTEVMSANVIAQSMYAQCDLDGNEYLLLEAIIDYKKSSSALSLEDQIIDRNGRRSLRRSTKGWELLCEWKDGSTSWQKLSDLKESHPLEVAEFALSHKIAGEPAFNWWVGWVLKKRDRIISQVKSRKKAARYLKTTTKYGIECPKTVADALAIDAATNTTHWKDAIELEMRNVWVAFNILPRGQDQLPAHQFMKCHMIFDIKMENFKRKARLVAGGHMTDTPATMTYASVVSRETVRIALLLAALNDLDIWAADVLNAFIQAPTKEKIWTILGKEFGPDEGKKAVIVRALYGLKSAGAAFRAHMGTCMRGLGYSPCLADPDLWMKKSKKEDGTRYYSYILCYVDDLLVIDVSPKEILDKIHAFFPLKPGSVGEPDQYLGARLRKKFFAGDHVNPYAWSLCPSKYVSTACKNVEVSLQKGILPSQYRLYGKAENPFSGDYKPENDTSPEVDPAHATWFMQQIGVLRWMVELGRVDIATEVSMLASHCALPREGHLHAVLHIYSYLRKRHNSRMVFDPSQPGLMTDFPICDWNEFYRGAEEAIPSNAPEPLGFEPLIRMFVDSDHAGDNVTRRSRTGFLIYLNNALINWTSKKQSTIETSVFGAEFCAMKHGIETLRGIRYKLRMMGVPVTCPSYVYGDNKSVITNSSKPESTLKKKSNSICFHAVREAVAMKECLIAHISTKKNLADLMTKALCGVTRRNHVEKILYDVYEHNES